MTLISLTPESGRTGSLPVPPAAVPVQRQATQGVAPSDICTAPDAAERALNRECRSDRDVVAWLSGHIATLDRIIYPAADRHLGRTEELRGQRAATHRLALLVRRLHAQLDGDGAALCEDLSALRLAVLAALREHSRAERDLLDRLRAEMPAAQWTALAARYAEHRQHGPTRPHPHAPRTGLSGRAAYRVSTWADHILDVLDSRAVSPIPVPTDAPAA